eukprot:scaffold165834_cov55-Attheya_sp.AAC.2
MRAWYALVYPTTTTTTVTATHPSDSLLMVSRLTYQKDVRSRLSNRRSATDDSLITCSLAY